MTSEVEQRPRHVKAGYRRHRSQWVKVQMKMAWNLKDGGITGFTVAEDELPLLHDVFSSAIQSGCQRASSIVQFLWRDLTSGYDMIGSYFDPA